MNIKKADIIWKTVCDNNLNIDSITSWQKYILVSSKDQHKILCYNKNNGKLEFSIGEKGYDYDKFNRPNGLTVIGNYLFVIERNNKRCQIINMKTRKSMSFFGYKKLEQPYGISGFLHKDQYIIFISDNKLDKIFKFNIVIENNEIKKISSSIFIELPGSSLESLLIDYNNERILIAQEERKKIKIFNYDKILIKEINNIFEGQPEGITMTNNNYIFTDQNDDKTFFHVYDKNSLEYKYSINNNLIKNTDGIHFEDGYLYAIDNDCSLAKLNILEDQHDVITPLIIIGSLIGIFKYIR